MAQAPKRRAVGAGSASGVGSGAAVADSADGVERDELQAPVVELEQDRTVVQVADRARLDRAVARVEEDPRGRAAPGTGQREEITGDRRPGGPAHGEPSHPAFLVHGGEEP